MHFRVVPFDYFSVWIFFTTGEILASTYFFLGCEEKMKKKVWRDSGWGYIGQLLQKFYCLSIARR